MGAHLNHGRESSILSRAPGSYEPMPDAHQGALVGEIIVANFTVETHGAYLDMCKRSKWARDNVAAAWRETQALAPAGNLATDGQTVTFYGHPIARTLPDGTKVGIDCHASPTTTKNCGAILTLADVIEDCPCRPGWARGAMGDGRTPMPSDVRRAMTEAGY